MKQLSGGLILFTALSTMLLSMISFDADAARIFNAQQFKGTYRPNFMDVQATLAYHIASNHEIEMLGLWQRYRFDQCHPRGWSG